VLAELEFAKAQAQNRQADKRRLQGQLDECQAALHQLKAQSGVQTDSPGGSLSPREGRLPRSMSGEELDWEEQATELVLVGRHQQTPARSHGVVPQIVHLDHR
jgi:hypothetical protein